MAHSVSQGDPGWVAVQQINEKLAANVVSNWERFVGGLQQVTHVQADIEVTTAPRSACPGTSKLTARMQHKAGLHAPHSR